MPAGVAAPPSGTNSTVADLMTAPAVTVEPTTTVRQAANVMRGRSIGCLVVVESGHAIGIVTVSDLLELVGRGLDRGAVTTSTTDTESPRTAPKVEGSCGCLVTSKRTHRVSAEECPMSPHVERFVDRLHDAEEDLKREAKDQQRRWQYRVHRGRVWFDKELRETHRKLRQSIPAYILEGNLLSLLTAPVIYSLLLPLVLLDLWVTLYQSICFPIYGMARVPRRRYFAIDRHKLAYLNGIEKVNCTFCSYANGLIAYVREVAARTEQYWCPIKHARAIPAPHQRYHGFLDYGDAHWLSKGATGSATCDEGTGPITAPVSAGKPSAMSTAAADSTSLPALGRTAAAYWSLDPTELAKQLQSTSSGLSGEEAARRLRTYGPNETRERRAGSRPPASPGTQLASARPFGHRGCSIRSGTSASRRRPTSRAVRGEGP